MFWKKNLSVFTLFILAASTVYLRPDKISLNKKIIPPPKGMEHVHFGFRENIADFLWLGYIQNAFDCSKYKDPKKERCSKRWGYKTLKAASDLAPKFEALYKFGAVELTVLLDDHFGAAELFDTGMTHLKNNWLITYRAAYLHLEELKDYKKAGELMEKTAELGGPFWTKSLASRIYDKSGRLELSYRVLEDLYAAADEGPWKEDLSKRMIQIAQKLRSNSLN